MPCQGGRGSSSRDLVICPAAHNTQLLTAEQYLFVILLKTCEMLYLEDSTFISASQDKVVPVTGTDCVQTPLVVFIQYNHAVLRHTGICQNLPQHTAIRHVLHHRVL